MDGLEFIEGNTEDCGKYNDGLSIDDESYKAHERVYNYSMKMTDKELKQAVEGMYHNLNTLQSRSGKGY